MGFLFLWSIPTKKNLASVFLIGLSVLITIPNLNIHAAGAASQSWSFRDDFNYTSVSQLQAAGWSLNPNPNDSDSWYGFGNSTLTLFNDAGSPAFVTRSDVPANVSNWSVSVRGEAQSGSTQDTIQLFVPTAKILYTWTASSPTNSFILTRNSTDVESFPGYTPSFNTWHTLQLDMISGTLYMYFDGSFIGNYTEPDKTAGDVNLKSIEVSATEWGVISNAFDWVHATNSPQLPTPYFTMVANPSSVALQLGQSTNTTIQLKSYAAFTGTVSLNAVSPTSGPAVRLSPITVVLASGGTSQSTLTVVAENVKSATVYNVNVTATSGSLSLTTMIQVEINYPAHAPIIINTNADFTAANGVSGGNGSATNPYLIQEWNISYSGSPGIEIRNATAYFVVRNVYLGSTVAVFRNDTNGRVEASTFDDKGGSYDIAVLVASSSNITFTGDYVAADGGATALEFYNSSGVTVQNSTLGFPPCTPSCIGRIYYTGQALTVEASKNVAVQGNTVTAEFGWGLMAENSVNVHVSGNRLSGYDCANSQWCAPSAAVLSSSNIILTANNVTGNGIMVDNSNYTLAYHNNILQGGASDSRGYHDQWDNGYPSGGNFWWNYGGVDKCGGPQQNICPSPDGIGDTPYTINPHTVYGDSATPYVDNYPLMKPYASSSSAGSFQGCAATTLDGNTPVTSQAGTVMLDCPGTPPYCGFSGPCPTGLQAFNVSQTGYYTPTFTLPQYYTSVSLTGAIGCSHPMAYGPPPTPITSGAQIQLSGTGSQYYYCVSYANVPASVGQLPGFTISWGGGTTAFTQTTPSLVVPAQPPPPPPLRISETTSPTQGVVGHPVTFTGTASGGTSPYAFTWNFGDGNTGSGPRVTHSYSTPGTYRVVFAVNDSASPQNYAYTAWYYIIHSNPAPTPSFTYSPSSPTAGATVTFTGTATGGTPPYSFTWDFGDRTGSSGSTVTHTYSSPGNYTVYIHVADSSTPPWDGPVAFQNITVSPRPSSTTYVLSWQGYDWDGGHEETVYLNGHFVTALPPTSVSSNGGAWASFSLNITSFVVKGTNVLTFAHANWDCGASDNVRNLQVTNGATVVYDNSTSLPLSCTQTLTYFFTVGTAPPPPPPLSISFSSSPANPTVGQTITFTASASGGTPPLIYSWSFGDFSGGSGPSTTHAYTAPGNYTVILTVTDSGSPSQQQTVTRTLTVTQPPPPPLSASFAFNPTSPAVGQTVSFSATATGGSPPYSFSWNFGDGSTGSGMSVNHAYSASGTYTVSLTVTDSTGKTQTVTHSLAITQSPPPPFSAAFTYSPSNPLVNQPVGFTGTASGGVGPYSYGWNFGDGTTGSGGSVSHTYSSPGTYTVVLTAHDSGSPMNTQTVTKSITVGSTQSSSTYILSWQGYDWDGGGEETITINGHTVTRLPAANSPQNGGVWASFSLNITSYVVKGTNTITFTHANWDCSTSDNVRNLQVTSGSIAVYSNSASQPLSCTQSLTYTFTV